MSERDPGGAPSFLRPWTGPASSQAAEGQLSHSKAEGGHHPASLLRPWETAEFCRPLAAGPTGRGPVGTSNLADPDTDPVGRDRQVAGRSPCFSLMPAWTRPCVSSL